MKGQNYNITNKLDWYAVITDLIEQGLEDFVSEFYPDNKSKKISTNGFSLEPCPMCGHKNCCRVTSEIHGAKCFSCDWKGSYINSYVEYASKHLGLGYFEALKKFESYYGVNFPNLSPADAERVAKQQRIQSMWRQAEVFFHEKLINEGESIAYDGVKISPYKYLINKRGRKESTIKDFMIGYSKDFIELKIALRSAGFTEEEISATKLEKAPEGVLLYFYHHPITKDIIRVNCKNPFGVRQKFRDANGIWVETENVIEGWSSGDKVIYCGPGFSFKKPVVLVEGENDIQAIYEQNFINTTGIGGNPLLNANGQAEPTLEVLSRCEDDIYTMFDNDAVGEKYTNIVNDMFPDKVIKKIVYDTAFNDPDEYFKKCANPLSMEELMANAVSLTTDKYKIKRDAGTWTIKDRTKTLEFIVRKRNEKGQLIGTANLYGVNGKVVQRQEDTTLAKCTKTDMRPFCFYLSDEIDLYFNSGLEECTFLELADRYFWSARRREIIDLLALRLFETESQEEIDRMSIELRRVWKNMPDMDKIAEQVWIEFGNLKNEDAIKERRMMPKIKISQYYNIPNNDAYFYYTAMKDDGDAQRAIPYLLRNDGTSIRLDLLRRKDIQCLLLIDNKYELPAEVPTAIFDSSQCSLQDYMVDEFKAGNIPDEDLDPCNLIKEVESWIRKFYYSNNEDVYKVLALWIYGTYFYIMFGRFPYLHINGEKGSGKTILNNVLSMLAFNGRTLIEATEASLFRMAGQEGGTMMLDELETLTSRTSGIQDSFGAILKSGYQSGTLIPRTNLEKNCQDYFDPFCPKTISNIFGLEDIISDRCIPVSTYRLTISRDLQIEDPKYFMNNDQQSYRNLTSRLCFSALRQFQELHDIYVDKNTLFESSNARLSELMTPILALAKFVDKNEVAEKRVSLGMELVTGAYETAFLSYYTNTIQPGKSETEDYTHEGIIKKVVQTIAMELAGKIEREYSIMSNRKYTEPIAYSKEEGWFELNVIHFKCFLEENMPGDKIYTRHIPKWLRICFNFDKSEIKRKTVHLENDELVREMQGLHTTKVNAYRFYLRDFVKSEFLEEKAPVIDNTEEEEKAGIF